MSIIDTRRLRSRRVTASLLKKIHRVIIKLVPQAAVPPGSDITPER